MDHLLHLRSVHLGAAALARGVILSTALGVGLLTACAPNEDRAQPEPPDMLRSAQQTQQTDAQAVTTPTAQASQASTHSPPPASAQPQQARARQAAPAPATTGVSASEPNQAQSNQANPADQADQQDQANKRGELRTQAEEIRAAATVSDLTGLTGWLNGEETSIALELAQGNVVLVDFWTYTCINCIRTLPFLTAWDEQYREHGLVILGVHTPEFEFEQLPANIAAAIAEHGIAYRVPIDNDYRTWRAFQNRFWPAKYLIGPTDDGSPMGIRYQHFGEGRYQETEREIRAALEAVGRDLSDVPFGVDVSPPTREQTSQRQTRELYAGWRRNTGAGGPYAGQEAYFLTGPDIPTRYRDVETRQRQHNLWYIEGLWTIESEAIVHARETTDLEDYIALLMRGRTANVVLTAAADGEPYEVYVQLDGQWLDPNTAGAHIRWDARGRSYIRVTKNDLYRLIFLPEWSERELRLSSNSDQFRIFAFTFGSYIGGE